MVSARGATVPRLAFDELAANSGRIVHGRILDSSVGSSGQFLSTHYRVEVIDGLKNGTTGQIVVSEPGGTLNGITMELAGGVRFQTGEEVVLFLYQTPIGYWRTSGYWQGKFNVELAGNEKRVRANLADIALVTGPGRAAAGALESLDRMPLEQFKAEIRRRVRQ
jgi:hypothetical protein